MHQPYFFSVQRLLLCIGNGGQSCGDLGSDRQVLRNGELWFAKLAGVGKQWNTGILEYWNYGRVEAWI